MTKNNATATPWMLIVCAIFLVGCGPPDTLPLSDYDKVRVSVYAYDPSDKEHFLGETLGASSCGSMAHGWANSKGFSRSARWGYVCCTHEADSKCYRKIR